MSKIESRAGRTLGTNMNRRALLGRLTVAAGAAYVAPVMLSLSQARATSSGGGSGGGSSYSGGGSSSNSSYSGGSSSSSSSYSGSSGGSHWSGSSSNGSSRSSYSRPRRTLEQWWRGLAGR